MILFLVLFILPCSCATAARFCNTTRAVVGNSRMIMFERGQRASDRHGFFDLSDFRHYQIYCTTSLLHRSGLLNESLDSYDPYCDWDMLWPEEIRCIYIGDPPPTIRPISKTIRPANETVTTATTTESPSLSEALEIKHDKELWKCESVDNIMVTDIVMHCPFSGPQQDPCKLPIESCYVQFAVSVAYYNTVTSVVVALVLMIGFFSLCCFVLIRFEPKKDKRREN